jgi:uncharacterized protein YbcV (DUF1398 family)
MDKNKTLVMTKCTTGSLDGSLTFPAVVKNLIGIGVEFYHADLNRLEKTYYLPDGKSHTIPMDFPVQGVQNTFSPDKVRDAVKTIQRGEIDYREFLERIMEAGTVFYYVFISGKQAIYFGRNGDTYTETFPGS